MGCDGFIENSDECISVEITCYGCGEEIELDDRESVEKHKLCGDGDGIPIDISFSNYSDR